MSAPDVAMPPLLPDDIVVPPRPPLPSVGATTESDDADAEPDQAVDEPDAAVTPDAAGSAPAEVSTENSSAAGDAESETVADPSPADVAVEEPVVDPAPADVAVADPIVADVVVEEPVAGTTPADVAVEEPAAQTVADPTPGDVAVEEPATVAADTPQQTDPSSPLVTSSSTEVVAETPLEHDLPSESAAPAATPPSEGSPASADGVSEQEDPTPADVRVYEAEPADPETAPFVAPASTEVPETTGVDAAGAEDDGQTAVLDASPAETLERAVDPEPRSEVDESVTQVDDALVPAAVVAGLVDAPTASDDETAVPALALRTITKSFGELRAVDAIDLTVPAGAFYGLVGPNGAGKTTTLSIIAGLLRPDRGTVTINGVDAAKRSREAKKLIGVLPDRLRTFDRLTGRQLLSYYGALRGLPAALVESRTADLARAFDLVEALSRPVSDYSAGMTKKVMLAGAMIHSPRLLVLDEPFEAVDPVSSGVILDILGTYVEHGGTVILSSHGMELVERVCSRVAVIVSGQVLAEGTVDEVRGEGTLEQRFRELSGGLGDVEGLEWLHTFSA
ncbi:ATP-binding cassette domain-containing protein [Microbacterium sp. SORGH_AS_0454]|uniref:ABC transporter ATP-binding protein n=1 Tax=Microbacterium sp. SORGH_AS_0454 TaxID=3041758 RepID=UPI00285D247D|nr:ATP-binding cassette domain-containing protein [Microbacterium sp. SORGH_AS_0454]MDR6098735.1 ABC-type multidrug transport system ATPase subunit [Microbacterium sp. SORGH_AS_0454]